MDEEPEFLINDFLLASQQELAHVSDVAGASLDPLVGRRALLLKEFTVGLYRAYARRVQPVPDRALLCVQLETKKAELLVQLEKLRMRSVEELPSLPRVTLPETALPELMDLPEP